MVTLADVRTRKVLMATTERHTHQGSRNVAASLADQARQIQAIK